ncbi:hypothetical protein BHE74_00059130 [Ensete ventricosum]|nr:hypothetical protein GW17_00026805 [Ensete ventricosum]RWW35890.1 hypothetical protein BHE74_00059130 [Ensete ventricosum]
MIGGIIYTVKLVILLNLASLQLGCLQQPIHYLKKGIYHKTCIALTLHMVPTMD